MSTKAENTIIMAGPEPPGIADTAGDSVVSESEVIIANDVDEIDTVMADLKRKKALRSDGAAASATSTTTLTPALLSGDEKTALAMNISTAMSAPGAYDSDNIRRSTAQKTPSEGQFSEMARLRNTQKDRQRYQQPDRGLEGCIPDNDDFIDDMQNRMTGFDAKVTVQNADEDEKRKQKLRRRALIVMLALLIVLGVVVGIIFGMMGEKSNDEIDSLAVTLAPTAAPQLDFYSNDCVVTNVTAAEERTERYTQFRSSIDAIIPSMITAIDAPFSKERLALCWLSNMDGLVVKHDTSAGIVGEQREAFIQRYVLAVIYFHFTKTSALAGADTDLMETNWLASIHECEWNGVICDMNQKVQELILNNYGLAGHIPSELTLLTKLLALDMSVNSLTGEVPVEMYSLLPQLDALNLDTNQLSGAVLEDAAKLKNLAALQISNNFFTGTIPAAWSMERLRILDMKYNDFEGTFPDLSASTALEVLDISQLDLTGTIPASFWTLTNLKTLAIGGTYMYGTVPTEIGDLEDLETLSLVNGRFSGSIPSEVGRLANLVTADFSLNRFTGTIPMEICALTINEEMVTKMILEVQVDGFIMCDCCTAV